MGSDIQSLAIPATDFDSATNHSVGLTSLEILHPRTKSRPHLEVHTLLSLAANGSARWIALRDEFSSIGSEGAVIA